MADGEKAVNARETGGYCRRPYGARESALRMESFTLIGGIVVVVLSITSHEAAHAWVADRLGDPTARQLGRVTLSPFPHIDPLMTILLPGFLLLSGANIIFGGAKPVPVIPSNLRHPRRDWALVGAAGPACNILMALILGGLMALLLAYGGFTATSVGSQVLALGLFVNTLLAVFNLIPIPPLDGSRVVQYFLTPTALRAYHRLEQYGFLILIALIFFVPGVQPLLGGAIFWTLHWISVPFGIEDEVGQALTALFSGSG
jgi:Zn-dependent protease